VLQFAVSRAPMGRDVVRNPLLISFLLLYAALPCDDAGAQATLTKCTCHVADESSTEDKDGSRAVNATLCVQQLDKNRHWCEVTIECLRGRIGPDCSSMPKDAQELGDLFRTHIEQLRLEQSPAAKEMIEKSKDTFASIYGATKYDADTYAKCFDALQARKEINLKGSNQLSCLATSEGSATVKIDAPPYVIIYSFDDQIK